MEKQKSYEHICFFADTIKDASTLFLSTIQEDVVAIGRTVMGNSTIHFEDISKVYMHVALTVRIGPEVWTHDSENEFFADYRKDPSNAFYTKSIFKNTLSIHTYNHSSDITVSCNTRSQIESIFEVFEENIDPSKCIKTEADKFIKPTVFIGHGRSPLWRDLKDHLHDKHNYEIEAYEVGARAGHAIRDILENMLGKSSFAILVLTGEDETSGGQFRARQNVIHETGLFQGRLGFSKAIVLLEEGTEEFSNIQGIEHIQFSKNSIKETFGEVLATIEREYPG